MEITVVQDKIIVSTAIIIKVCKEEGQEGQI